MAIKHKYRNIVGAGTKAAGAIGIPGAFSFGLDVTVMSSIWVTMLIAISKRSNHTMDLAFALKVTSGVLAGVAAYVGGSKLAMKLLHLIPGIGTLGAIGVNSSLNYLFTYKFGHAISNLFDRGEFDKSDVVAMVSSIMTLVAAIPTLDEARDMVSLGSEAVDRTSFEAFYSEVLSERTRRGI